MTAVINPLFRSCMLVHEIWEASQAANNMSKLLAGATGLQGNLSPAERSRHEWISVFAYYSHRSRQWLVRLRGYEL